MRNRSITIIADNMNDYIYQMEISRINIQRMKIKMIFFFQLFDFDLLSVNESKNIFNSEENN